MTMEEGHQMQTLTSNDNGHSDYPKGYASLKERQKWSKGKRCCCVIASLLLILVFLSAVVILVVLMLMVGQRAPRVQTNCGMVQGDYDTKTDSFIFKGIPYAVPPTSSNRWKPPIPLDNTTCWRDIMLVDRFPEPCVQPFHNSRGYIGTENCLYLNIYSPDPEPLEPVPVMVYLHGGYLQYGHINVPSYVPDEKTAQDLNVVFVNVQYRLGPFGWFVSELLPQADNHTGNYGLLDQIQALRWVQQNIRNFGGDPDQVTVFGHSSGGTAIELLLSTELATGLFHRAWISSASNLVQASYEQTAAYNQAYVNKTDCLTQACLMNLSTSDALHMVYPEWHLPLKNSMDLPTKGVFEPALVVVDGEIIKKPILQQWDEKMPGLPDVPVLIGVTAQEVDMQPPPGPDIEKWTHKKLYEYVHQHLGAFDTSFVNESLALYPEPEHDDERAEKYASEYIFTTMTSDARVVCGNEVLVRSLSGALMSPVYRYVVTAWPSAPAEVFESGFRAKFAFHGLDIFAFLGTLRGLVGGGGDAGQDDRLRDTIRDNVMRLVHDGKVANSRWKPATPTNVTTALIAPSITIVNAYHKQQCRFWNDNGFFNYTWIN